ncbi:MAG: VTT domain-containing protein [Pseudomonadota bacterium]
MPDSAFLTHLHDAMAANMWSVYLCLLIAPFVQEDAAVLGAASLSLASMGDTTLLLIFVTIGLCLSDLWKYWLGRAARTQGWAQRFAEKPGVKRAQSAVLNRLRVTLMAVRFVPGTRIALYIAAGYFRASWPVFVLWIVVSAIVYVGIAFGFFHAIGAVAGEAARMWLPIVALGALALVLAVQFARNRRRKTAQDAA